MTPEESADFCISKCGCGYCGYMSGIRDGTTFPCVEYICTSCHKPKEFCNFCKTGET